MTLDSRTFSRLASSVIALLLLSGGMLRAYDVLEWNVDSDLLSNRTTQALLRYYTVVRGDSLQVRYVRRNASRFPYKVRAQFSDNDSLGRMLMISLGQLRLFSHKNLRIALGDDLYEELLESSKGPDVATRSVDMGSSFDHTDWLGDQTVAWSIWERLDVRVAPELNLFVGLGAPESNLNFWEDGTGRIGVASPGWEFALLFPYAAGGTAVGPLRPRLLAPGFGATGTLRYDNITARLRFTGAQDVTEESTRTMDRLFVHSISSELDYRAEFETSSGDIELKGGLGYEEFTELDRVDGELIPDGRVWRLSPVVGIRYTSPNNNLRVGTELYDLALRGEIEVKMTRNLWIEVRAVSNELLRDDKPFEHPFTLFFTPMLKF